MKTQFKKHKKRITYIIGALLILLITIWMANDPVAVLSEERIQQAYREQDRKITETKRIYRTGQNLRPFQRLHVVPYIDEPMVRFQFTPIKDDSGVLDSLSNNWQDHGNYALSRSFHTLTKEYQGADHPVLFGTWERNKQITGEPHFVVKVLIESVSVKRKHTRKRMWAYVAEDQFGMPDTAIINRCSLARDVEISGQLQILDASGKQVLRRPISRLKKHERSYYEKLGPPELLTIAPQILSNNLEGFAPYRAYTRSDDFVIKQALFDFAHEAVRCGNKWIVQPIYNAKARKGSSFDLRDREKVITHYGFDTTRVIQRQPEIPIYSPSKQ